MKTCTSNYSDQHEGITRQDVYTRVTDRIVADLEQGVRTWVKPWSAEHAAGKITRPLRHNGTPYSGINILMLWSAALAGGFAAPIWMTFKQALELKAHVRKGEKGSLVVYANSITRKETDDVSGDETEREIHFMKGYTVFNVEQIEGLPAHYYAKPEPRFSPVQRIEHAESFFANLWADTPTNAAGIGLFTITLTWNGSGDVDLHVFEPNGTHVYYAALTGNSGFLDVDNTEANGPEHYYATCDASRLQTGTYRVGINNFADATGRTATIQAASVTDGVLLTVVQGVGPERGSGGNSSPNQVMTVTVTKDPTTGRFQVEAH